MNIEEISFLCLIFNKLTANKIKHQKYYINLLGHNMNQTTSYIYRSFYPTRTKRHFLPLKSNCQIQLRKLDYGKLMRIRSPHSTYVVDTACFRLIFNQDIFTFFHIDTGASFNINFYHHKASHLFSLNNKRRTKNKMMDRTRFIKVV